MFVGHYGVSFASKAADPSIPLAALMISTQFLDVAWSSFILTGIEKVRITPGATATNDLDLYYMPFSHGCLAALGWSAFAGLATMLLLPGATLVTVAIVAAVCFSHWLLDLIVHTPDLPLVGNRYKVGLGLWNRRWLALALELSILFGGSALYLATLDFASALWWFVLSLSVALGALQLYALFGPQPKSPREMATSALMAYLVIGALSLAEPYL